jgi:hypothetical protein
VCEEGDGRVFGGGRIEFEKKILEEKMKKILASDIKEGLIFETVQQTRFSKRVGELHMSQLWKPVKQIIDEVINGMTIEKENFGRLYWGNLGERGMTERLESVCKGLGYKIETKKKLEAFEGMLTGEADAVINEKILIEMKTVPTDDAIEKVKQKSPYKVKAQLQAYMFYGKYERGIVIYESRATGQIYVAEMDADPNMQHELHNKAQLVLSDDRVIKMIKNNNADLHRI